MRRDKPWFGPSPISRNPFFPLRWEGWVVMVAFFLGMALLNLEGDLTRRSIAGALLVAAFCAVVILTWGDPDGEVRGWRETLFNRQTLVWLGVLVVLAAESPPPAFNSSSAQGAILSLIGSLALRRMYARCGERNRGAAPIRTI